MNSPRFVIASEARRSIADEAQAMDCRTGRHCEERSDAAIAMTETETDCTGSWFVRGSGTEPEACDEDGLAGIRVL